MMIHGKAPAEEPRLWFSGGRITVLAAVLIAFLSVSDADAELATAPEAELTAANWVAHIAGSKGGWGGSQSAEISSVSELSWDDTLLARVYSVSPSGFILVPALKEIAPIKVYSEECAFDAASMIGLPQLIREKLIHQARLFVDSYGSMEAVQPINPPPGKVVFAPRDRRLWDEYAAGRFGGEDESSLRATVGPLLTTYWDQTYPYNLLCPYGDGGTCVVGCVATAVAQIMRFWECPPTGVGSHSYTWDGDQSCGGSEGGGMLWVDFSDSYAWDSMPDMLWYQSCDWEVDAVAELCYEVGVAVEMDYGYCGSGAFTEDVISALVDHFRYSNAMEILWRINHSALGWFNIIKDEINAGRPLYFAITEHALVIDGWSDSGGINKYHLNYGWGGSHTAWYAVDNYFCDWGCYMASERIIRHIAPDPDWDDDGTPNEEDNCPLVVNPGHEDVDGDGVGDVCDNCIYAQNPDQADTDGDRTGDECDSDIDDDDILNEYDNCDYVQNIDQTNSDTDSLGDACDNCDLVDNPEQCDDDHNRCLEPWEGVGDACDGQLHVQCWNPPDGYVGVEYYYQFTAIGGVPPYEWEKVMGHPPFGTTFEGGETAVIRGIPMWPGEFFFRLVIYDSDSPPSSDTADFTLTIHPEPWVCGDADSSGVVDIDDPVYIVIYIFASGPEPKPYEAGDPDCTGAVDIDDAVYLINYIFYGGPPPCDPDGDGVKDCYPESRGRSR